MSTESVFNSPSLEMRTVNIYTQLSSLHVHSNFDVENNLDRMQFVRASLIDQFFKAGVLMKLSICQIQSGQAAYFLLYTE